MPAVAITATARPMTRPEVQLALLRIGRLYKDRCWRPWRGRKASLADKCKSSSWKAGSWSEHHQDGLADAKKATKAEIVDHDDAAVADLVAVELVATR